MKIGVGLYGMNGHQIQELLYNHPNAELVATAAFKKSMVPLEFDNIHVSHYETLEELIQDDRVQIVSLCSPHRKNQGKEAILCLKAGKHVYAEKPCVTFETELDEIMKHSQRLGLEFHEMADTAFVQPYLSMRQIVLSGVIGEIIQVFAQKSYPYHDERPQDEGVDGGLICQVGVHALRFIEHVACQRIKDIHAIETKLGNPDSKGNLHIAASFMMTLENGGVASVVTNYLNQKGFGKWSNEHLRIFGSKGFVESTNSGERTRLVIGDEDLGEIKLIGESKTYFDYYIDKLKNRGIMPLTIEEELHPTRMVLRAKARCG